MYSCLLLTLILWSMMHYKVLKWKTITVTHDIYLPSSHFHPSKKKQRAIDETTVDTKLQGDKRFVVALARNTHTWRVFPMPTRSHRLLSQHTIKEKMRIIGTFQLEWLKCESHLHQSSLNIFKNCKHRFGPGSIYKGTIISAFGPRHPYLEIHVPHSSAPAKYK